MLPMGSEFFLPLGIFFPLGTPPHASLTTPCLPRTHVTQPPGVNPDQPSLERPSKISYWARPGSQYHHMIMCECHSFLLDFKLHKIKDLVSLFTTMSDDCLSLPPKQDWTLSYEVQTLWLHSPPLDQDGHVTWANQLSSPKKGESVSNAII